MKPKEFWIEEYKSVFANPSDHSQFSVYTNPMPNKSVRHVIEYSEVERLRAELSLLKDKQSQWEDQAMDLADSLESLLEDMKHYYENRCIPTSDEVMQLSSVINLWKLFIAKHMSKTTEMGD